MTKKDRQARNQLWAVVLFALGILLLCLAVVPGESFWLVLHNFFRGCFSWCAFLIGPLVIYTAIMTAVDQTSYPVAAKVLSSSVLILLFSGASQIFSRNIPQGNFFLLVQGLYADGIQLAGGGVFSLVVGIPLLKLMDFTGAAITVVLLIFVFLMILSGGTLVGLFQSAVKPVRKLEEAYSSAVENRAAAREQTPPPRDFNINVPIDCEPLPRHGLRAPKSAILPPAPTPTPDPELSKAKEKLLDATAGLSRKGAYDYNADNPAPAAPVPAPGPTIDDIISQAVSGDVTLKVPQTKTGKLDFAPAVPAEKEPEAPAPISAPVPPAAPVIPEPLPPKVEGIHPDNTVAPTLGEPPLAEKPQYSFPPLNLLDEPKAPSQLDASRELKSNAELLENTLKSFGVQARIINVSRGPAVTRYELQPAAGVKISRVTGLADDIALNLAAAGVRIEAPIPNKPAIGIEVPNKVISTVSIKEIIDSQVFRGAGSPLTVSLGKDITGNVAVADIGKMPHVLIAGATGSGKSVCINSIIISLLYKSSPEHVKFLMIDPKVVELGVYNGIPHLLVPVVTDPKKAAGALCWAVGEMLRRYKSFADTGVRDLKGYNRLAEENGDLPPMPQIVIIIDELADLMMASPKDVEDYICRLAQMARAAGMHLVIATQRPSVDVITGLIKANIPSRISFAVSSAVDSRTILDGGGAEKLLGRGDMLFCPVGASKPMRIQGCFVTDQEVERVVAFVKEGEKPDYDEAVMDEIDRQAANSGGKGGSGSGSSDEGGDDDALLDDAISVVVEAGLASTSLLQRRLKVGYARAARLVDEMEQRGIVGPFEGSKPRQVLLSKDRYYEMKLNKAD